MLQYRNNIIKNYNLLNYSQCKKLIFDQNIDRIGSGRQAEIFKAVSDTCGSVIIKRAGKNKYDEFTNNKLFKKLTWENKILLKTNKLIFDNICPNFIERIDFFPQKKYLILEYADADSSKLLKEVVDFQLLYSFILQVLMGILCLNKILRIFHLDLHAGNILYKKINKNTVFCYIIDGTKYYIPTMGYLFMISDFGQSVEIDYLKTKTNNINENIDIEVFALRLDEEIVKLISKRHNKNYSNFKNIFTPENQQKINKLIKNNVGIMDIISNKSKVELLSLPIFDTCKLIDYGFSNETIELKNMLKNNISIIQLINKIYHKYNLTDNEYDINFIVSFTINL